MTKPRTLALGIGAAGVVCGSAALAVSGPAAWLLGWTALSCFVVAWTWSCLNERATKMLRP